jgi:phage virion morphogenesis protein
MPEHDKYYLYDDSTLQRLLKQVKNRIGNTKPAFEVIGEVIHASILKNFEDGGHPGAWPDLAASTKKQRARKGKWPGQILVMSGTRGGLVGSVSYNAMSDKVVFVANKPYAAIQHFGGMAGKGRKTEIPARPYMMIQDEDWTEIKAVLNDFIIKG